MQSYYHLAKPGIIYGNDISVIAGFMVASKTAGFDFWLLLTTLVGISFIIGSACVINNIIDKDIDQYMTRTKKRALVTKIITPANAVIYSIVLGLVGFGILIAQTNWITVVLGLIGYVDYIVFYGIGKRTTTLGTLIGSVAGATPIAAGYTAVAGRFDMAALFLFLAMVLWQMPHFYAIALRRLKEYKAAKLPVLPAEKGIQTTKIHILFYIAAFAFVAIMIYIAGYAGLLYFAIVTVVSFHWFYLGIKGFFTQTTEDWAKKMFLYSLVVMVSFCLALVLDSLIGGKVI